MVDIAIIGAGCAGLTAAIYGARAGKKVAVFEQESVGGQISFSQLVENYPGIKSMSGVEFSDSLLEQALSYGADLYIEKVYSIKDNGSYKTLELKKQAFDAKTVIIATGVKPRKLGLDNEDALVGNGISYCATCDGAFFKGKTVAVAGGGNTALQSAITLSGICEKVYLIHRRNEFRADERVVSMLKLKTNIEPVLNATIEKLVGDSALAAIEVKQNGQNRQIKLNGLFVCVGHIPSNEVFGNIVSLDEGGYIVAGEDCKTSCKGIFAAGDCRTKRVRQLTTAAADGSVAALGACEE